MISIYLAMPDDAEVIEEIRIAAWRRAYSGIMDEDFLRSLSPDKNISFLRGNLPINSNATTIIKASYRGIIIGFSVIKASGSSAETSEISALNVAPDYWRLGGGGHLVAYAIKLAQQKGKKAVELWCLKQNYQARDFYLKSGFSESGGARCNDWLTEKPMYELHFIRAI